MSFIDRCRLLYWRKCLSFKGGGVVTGRKQRMGKGKEKGAETGRGPERGREKDGEQCLGYRGIDAPARRKRASPSFVCPQYKSNNE